MTPKDLLLTAIVGYGIICFLVGYGAGSMRTFASLGYGSERLHTILRTLFPSHH